MGDYADAGIDTNDLQWQLTHPAQAARGHMATAIRESLSNINSALERGSGKITMYRAVPANIQEGTFRNGDWITPSRSYADIHADINGWDDYRVIEQEVSIDDVWWDGNDINEWGYDNGMDLRYKNTQNNDALCRHNGETVALPDA